LHLKNGVETGDHQLITRPISVELQRVSTHDVQGNDVFARSSTVYQGLVQMCTVMVD
jgi:hypothetical protein